MFGKDKEAFENEDANIPEEEEFLEQWRKEGPLGTLCDLIISINTPQLVQLFEQYQVDENIPPQKGFRIKQLIKPVKTRWNSYHAAFERATKLQAPLNSFAQYQITKHEKETASLRSKGKKVPEPRRYIAVGGLNAYDWSIINEYMEILSPLKETTSLVEGRGKAGKHGAIWEVIPTFDWLLRVFKEKKDRVAEAIIEDYPNQEAMEDHFMINMNAAWAKLNDYYLKLDDTPVYYAAVLLHPHFKRFCQNAWKDRPDWIISGDAAFQTLWLQYKDRPLPSSVEPETPPPKRVRASAGRESHIDAYSGASTPSQMVCEDEYAQWKLLDPLPKEHPLAQDPIGYWWQMQIEFPRLAQFAFNILTIPATSADCERGFSEAGDLLEPRRSRLQPIIIAALQCTRS